MMLQLWFGTPNEMGLVLQSATPGPIRLKAKDVLNEMKIEANKFEPETAQPLSEAIENLKNADLLGLPKGEPFKVSVNYMGVKFRMEIRNV